MSYVKNISNYYMTNVFRIHIILIAVILLIHVLASIAVDNLLGPEREAGIISFIVFIWVFSMGLVIFPPNFEYLLSQGISRKKFFMTTVFNLAVFAAVCAILVMIYYAVTLQTVQSSSNMVIYEAIYHNQNLLAMVVWEFTILFMLGMAGWTVSLIVYVSSRKIRISIITGLAILVPLLITLNNVTDRAITVALGKFIKIILGFSSHSPDSYTAAGSLLAIAVILGGVIFLILRRAQVRN
jgi:hypothetical protein